MHCFIHSLWCLCLKWGFWLSAWEEMIEFRDVPISFHTELPVLWIWTTKGFEVFSFLRHSNGAWTRWKACTSGETNARHRGSTVASLNPWGELIMKLSRKKRVMGSPPIIWLAEAQSSSFQWITRLQLWTSFHLRDRYFGSLNFSLAVTDGRVCPFLDLKGKYSYYIQPNGLNV